MPWSEPRQPSTRSRDADSLLATALGAATLAGTAPIGTALAQGDVIAERRAGLKRMGEHMQAMKAVVDSRGDVRPLAATVDDMIAWYRTMPALSRPAPTAATPALPAIWTESRRFRADQHVNMVNQLQVLRGRRGGRRRRRLRHRLPAERARPAAPATAPTAPRAR